MRARLPGDRGPPMLTTPAPRAIDGRSAVVLVVVSELLATSLWFSANGAGPALQAELDLTETGVGLLTNAVQIGFIVGTLFAGLSGLADRYRASRIFFASTLVGALANAGFALWADSLATALPLRFVVGIALAGIYPLGMKLVMSWTRGDSGTALALLVGMLTLGTALPHGVRAASTDLAWQVAVLSSSGFALAGGLMVRWLGDGPHLKIAATPKLALGAAFAALREPGFRASALGYWGHMWELYAFWTLVPFTVAALTALDAAGVSGLSFAIIAAGACGCFLGGALGRRIGKARTAGLALGLSGLACLTWPLLQALPWPVRLAILLIWGVAVVADSPQFSSLSADHAPPEALGSALAFQNAIGFAITTVAIAIAMPLYAAVGPWVAWLLLPGPIFGLLGMRPLLTGKVRPVAR